MPTAFRAMRASEIGAAKRARSSDMDVGEETVGAAEEMTGMGGERGALLDGEGDNFIPFVTDGLRIGSDADCVAG